MIKLHLFTGFDNPKLGITPDMELGHLYSDTGDQRELLLAASKVDLASTKFIQNAGGFVHFDLWGKPLIKAKKLYKIVTDQELAEDMKHQKDNESSPSKY